MAVMGNTQPPPHRVNGKWIIDTGCSHHVTGNLSCLTDVREVSPCNVGLPDGQNVIAMKEGVVKLTDKITLSNGWYLYDLDKKKFFVSRDVRFFEDVHPYLDADGTNIDVSTPNMDASVDSGGDLDATYILDEDQATLDDQRRQQPPVVTVPPQPAVAVPTPKATVQEDPIATTTTLDDMGRGHRQKFVSTKLKGFVTHAQVTRNSPSSSPAPVAPPPSGMPYPIAHYVSCDKFSAKHQNFVAAITAGKEPRSFKEAMCDEDWKQAMREEMNVLESNGTWTLENLPPGKKALGSQWLYKISIERLKARLVVFGNHQNEGIDYDETFALVVKMTTVRAFLAIAASKNWELHQMDVHNAFLHGDLTEEFYMKLPPGFTTDEPGLVCRLRKSLYGLKQAPRCWFAKLTTALKKYGFVQSYPDYSLFTYTKGFIQLNVLVYVDDLIVSGNNSNAIKLFKHYLSTCFHMKDLGVLKYFLGIEVARSSKGLFLCQRKYALDIISETGLLGAKPAHTPMEQNHRLAHAKGPLLTDLGAYRRLVGRLVYLGVTRPDLTYSVHVLSQFMKAPQQEHWDAALRVVRYLKCTPSQGLLLSLGIQHSRAVPIYCDSQATIHIAQNPVFHERTKHIEVDCHFVRDAVQEGLIATTHVRTNEQLADIFTKALARPQFDYLLSKLGTFDPSAPT
ncbi:uncharacterized protein LOC110714381 [Chenopodium quinoa]|uniref:uncharacterized protein LOC110714381 n=1 Tax=Chenopodium quinoa TaxID=63459 RepID=UPI000B76F6DE|nr:uncharacterized protein LOC110714381 [Chenopodium quinoa]